MVSMMNLRWIAFVFIIVFLADSSDAQVSTIMFTCSNSRIASFNNTLRISSGHHVIVGRLLQCVKHTSTRHVQKLFEQMDFEAMSLVRYVIIVVSPSGVLRA